MSWNTSNVTFLSLSIGGGWPVLSLAASFSNLQSAANILNTRQPRHRRLFSINQSVKIYIAPLQDTYSEALPTQAKRKRSLEKVVELASFGRCLRSTGSPFQVFGPSTENERVCIVAERADGTTEIPWTEGRSVRQPIDLKREGGRARAGRRAPSQTGTATPRTRSYKRCVVGMEASAIRPTYIYSDSIF